jgi:hypothetical protein
MQEVKTLHMDTFLHVTCTDVGISSGTPLTISQCDYYTQGHKYQSLIKDLKI